MQTSRDPLRKSPRGRREGRRGTPLLLKIRRPVKPPGSRWPLQPISVLLPPKPCQPLLRSPPVARLSVPAAPPAPPRQSSRPPPPPCLLLPLQPLPPPPRGPPPPAAQPAGPSPGRSSLAGPSRAPGAETTPGAERGHARSAAASHLSEGAAAAGAGAGARSAFDSRGEEGGGRARFIIGDGGCHLKTSGRALARAVSALRTSSGGRGRSHQPPARPPQPEAPGPCSPRRPPGPCRRRAAAAVPPRRGRHHGALARARRAPGQRRLFGPSRPLSPLCLQQH